MTPEDHEQIDYGVVSEISKWKKLSFLDLWIYTSNAIDSYPYRETAQSRQLAKKSIHEIYEGEA